MKNLASGYLVFSGDFFTYSDKEDAYWSGFYTSRAFYKKLDRVLESRLRAAEIAFSIANFMAPASKSESGVWKNVSSYLLDKLTVARRNLGLFQHHDGITGTSRVK